ncbi:MAG TPA: DUF1501 domain-containing protein [Gemmataceae bacterium]|nr:DUF1501 domain-containing protein [Gemmataceae bacterium]
MLRTRRDFLKDSVLLALAPTVPGFLAQTARAAKPQQDGRVLVVIQLDGGNDGINTVVPFADAGYAKHRKVLRLPAEGLIKLNDQVALHPSLADAGKLLEAGRLSVIQGVSYPNPNRSHFRSMAIWHSARLDPEEHTGLGWLGRALDGAPRSATGDSASLLVGSGPPPVAIRGRRAVASAVERPEDFALSTGADPRRALPTEEPADDLAAFVRRSMLDAYATADRLADVARARDSGARYPETGLADRLRLIARLLKAGFGTRVFYTLQPGYDTHSTQLQTHSNLLFELAGALRAFLDDLAASGLADRVAVLAFSEFGRTVVENGSAGTDHGTAGPVFLAGARVKPGVVGATPRLLDLDPRHGDLRMGIDFRRVYAGVLEDWLGLPARSALGASFERLPLFRG